MDQAQDCCLARPGGSGQKGDLTFAQVQGYVVQRLSSTIRLCDGPELYHDTGPASD